MSKFKVFIDAQTMNNLINLIHSYSCERFAGLMGNVEFLPGTGNIIRIKETWILDDNDYIGLYTVNCKPKKEVIEKMLLRLQQARYSAYIEFHTHPFNFPRFSSTDNEDEKRMWDYFHHHMPNKYYGNLVLDINHYGEAVIRDWHNGRLETFELV